jgi:hypothetical protein
MWAVVKGEASGALKRHYNDSPPHVIARERERAILDICSNILDLFKVIEDELLQQKLGYVCSGI